jgi:hypothetical protein
MPVGKAAYHEKKVAVQSRRTHSEPHHIAVLTLGGSRKRQERE